MCWIGCVRWLCCGQEKARRRARFEAKKKEKAAAEAKKQAEAEESGAAFTRVAIDEDDSDSDRSVHTPPFFEGRCGCSPTMWLHDLLTKHVVVAATMVARWRAREPDMEPQVGRCPQRGAVRRGGLASVASRRSRTPLRPAAARQTSW